jgi:Domain of unknown function (DUF4190)
MGGQPPQYPQQPGQYPQQQQQYPQQPGQYPPPGGYGYGQPPRTNGMAIASLILGILWICGIGSILALIFGLVARNQIRDSRGQQQGDGMAIAGIVLGGIGVALMVLGFIFDFATFTFDTT